jgi:hypothetical protein
VARFSLEEYPAVTPLSQPLSREEATMLRFRDWVEEAICRGDDLVIDVVCPAGDAAGAPASARLVLSPKDGFLLTALPDGDRACGLAVSHTNVSLLPAGGDGRLDIPLPSRCWLMATVGLSLVQEKTRGEEPPKFKRNLSVGCSFGNVTDGKPADGNQGRRSDESIRRGVWKAVGPCDGGQRGIGAGEIWIARPGG